MITVTEPTHDKIAKDSDGYRWKWDEAWNGWTMLNFDHIWAYVGLSWRAVERDYGPMQIT